MKLLFSISFYAPYVSGLSLYAKRLAEKLSEKQFKSCVITNRHKTDLSGSEEINGVKVIRAKPLFSVSKGFISPEFAARSIIEAAKSDAIIVNLPQFEGIFPALAGKILGKKVIAIYHCEVILPAG